MPETHILNGGGASFVLDTGGAVPRVLHWGADLGLDPAELLLTADPAVLNNAPDAPRLFTTWASEADGWSGSPALRGHAVGTATTPRARIERVEVDGAGPGDGGEIRVVLRDDVTAMTIVQTFALDRFGVLTVRNELTRDDDAATPYTVDGVLALLPVPARASEILDFTGKWVRERAPQRFPLPFGTHRRGAYRGKPGHDSPYLMVAGEPGFGFGSGEVWSVHLAWSGDSEYLVEKLAENPGVHSAVLGAGESLHPGEVILAAGESYRTPDALFTWSGAGLDGIAHRMHARMRARASHPAAPRPLVLNTWEAVYFDHDMSRLGELVEAAASVGVERVVLDDGWFLGRRADNAGLGDWVVDREVWPDGLTPFVEAVREHGMQFGLWFEPEMINPDSELAREHPDWILGPSAGLGVTSRNQYVLDISRPDAYQHVLEQISALVDEYGVDFIKWDHNRDLLEAVGRTATGERPAVHAQTRALYRMLDTLRERHPRLEIETCAGGGGRVDLGILDRTDRLWPSDCNDPVERMRIERYTRLLVPPELIGSHLGDEASHTTWRRTDLSMRLISALFSHSGIEMDLTRIDEPLRDTVRVWADLYKQWRDTIHSGRFVNADLDDEQTLLHGVVSADGDRALYAWARFGTSPEGQSGRVRFPGLEPEARYRVSVHRELGDPRLHGGVPAWLSAALDGSAELSGALLGGAGVPLPTLNPQQAMLIELERIA